MQLIYGAKPSPPTKKSLEADLGEIIEEIASSQDEPMAGSSAAPNMMVCASEVQRPLSGMSWMGAVGS